MARIQNLTIVKSATRSSNKRALEAEAMLRNARKASGFLKALSNESRLAILCLLVDGEKTVSEISELLNLRQPTVSQQFARLRHGRLVKVRRAGKCVHYSIARPEVFEIISALHRSFCS